MYIRRLIIGTTIKKTIDILKFNLIAIIILPIHNNGAFTKILIRPLTKFCTCVTSLVSLVTSDAVPNLSIFSIESFCIFLKRSDLRSAPNFCDTLLDIIFLLTAASAPTPVTISILAPMLII